MARREEFSPDRAPAGAHNCWQKRNINPSIRARIEKRNKIFNFAHFLKVFGEFEGLFSKSPSRKNKQLNYNLLPLLPGEFFVADYFVDILFSAEGEHLANTYF